MSTDLCTPKVWQLIAQTNVLVWQDAYSYISASCIYFPQLPIMTIFATFWKHAFWTPFCGAEVKVCAPIFRQLSQVGRGLKYKCLMAMCVIFS